MKLSASHFFGKRLCLNFRDAGNTVQRNKATCLRLWMKLLYSDALFWAPDRPLVGLPLPPFSCTLTAGFCWFWLDRRHPAAGTRPQFQGGKSLLSSEKGWSTIGDSRGLPLQNSCHCPFKPKMALGGKKIKVYDKFMGNSLEYTGWDWISNVEHWKNLFYLKFTCH